MGVPDVLRDRQRANEKGTDDKREMIKEFILQMTELYSHHPNRLIMCEAQILLFLMLFEALTGNS